MKKPFYRSESKCNFVVVEEYGLINLNDLPFLVRQDESGRYELGWVGTWEDGKRDYILCEHGGKSALNYGGRYIGVINDSYDGDDISLIKP